MTPDERITVVVLTHERVGELLRTLVELARLPERPAIVVADNASRDGTAARVAREFPQVTVVDTGGNLGAAGRNAGVARVRTHYVAFCDDDTWWAPGSLARAADLLDAHPRIGALNARVLVGPEGREDPTCEVMATSPLPAAGLPGPALIGFMAGAVVMRTAAFSAAGGYEPRLFLGCEERLLGLDLLAAGWQIVYVPGLVVHHHPSSVRDSRGRRLLMARNTLWIAWLRLPWRRALFETRRVLREARAQGLLGTVLRAALPGLPWALRRRRVLPPAVEAMRWRVLHGPPRERPMAPGAACRPEAGA
ncbi:glycosyltransferase family 2 protein [Caldimonas tepidiphila]|uniref:glycosyltransferase family 2 protein n=1 Tax=Caldimonas tepidiphila TaxID=2315841 RepID=UPI000E5A1780|nr:glycosyltransferase [Caldimonas tepidiphila]